MAKCANCEREAEFKDAQPGADEVCYCPTCVPPNLVGKLDRCDEPVVEAPVEEAPVAEEAPAEVEAEEAPAPEKPVTRKKK